MPLFWRLWTAVTAVTAAVLVLFVALASLQFGNIHSTLVGERLQVLAERTAAPFAAATRLGLPLSTVRNAAALLERARQTDDAIAAIHVFDAHGTVVHTTESQAPTAIPPSAAAARAAARGTAWFRESAEGFLIGIDIVARDGASAGGILIVYPRIGSVMQARAMVAELASAAMLILGVAAALAALLMRRGLARPIRRFDRIDAAVANFERDAWRGAAGGDAGASSRDDHELYRLLDAAEARYREMGREMGRETGRAMAAAPGTDR